MIIEDALNELDRDSLKRDYGTYMFNGHFVPRVTEILSCFSIGDALMVWANRLGYRHISYREELKRTANIGTASHKYIERFLKDKEEKKSDVPFQGFLLWWNFLIQNCNKVNILGSEVKLSCEWYGGTYDMLIEIDGRIFLVDFKTSNHVTSKYFMQTAAYRRMIYETQKINIDGIIILQLNKDTPGFNEYLLDFSIPEHYQFIEACNRAFLSLVYAFYNLNIIQMQYDSIFGGK